MALESRTVEELRGRVALVTGVGRRAGIGAAIARELSAAGADVFISYLHAYDAAQPWGADTDMPGALLAAPRDVARVVRLLARDDAANVSGQVLRVQPSAVP